MHRVTPVTEAKEDRISFIVSFTTTDVFAQDNTRTVKFTKDPENIMAWEMAKHTAWRVGGQLDYLIDESDPNQMDPQAFADYLNESAAKLQRAANIILDLEDDAVGHVDAAFKTHKSAEPD
jgi:hypothetical protein